MEINNAFDAPGGASGGASRAELLYANAGIVIPEKGAVHDFSFPLLVPALPGRGERRWHFYPVPGRRVEAAGAADAVIYGVSNTIRTPLRCPGITCSSQALSFPCCRKVLRVRARSRVLPWLAGCPGVLIRTCPGLFGTSAPLGRCWCWWGLCVLLTISVLRELFLWILVGKCSRRQQLFLSQSRWGVGCCDSHSARGCQKAPKCHIVPTPFCLALFNRGPLETGFLSSLRGMAGLSCAGLV